MTRRTCCPRPGRGGVLLAYDSLGATFARSFVLVAEILAEHVATRTILKATYGDDRAKQTPQVNLTGRVGIDVEANGWGNTTSWHLEVWRPGAGVDQPARRLMVCASHVRDTKPGTPTLTS